MGGGLVILCLGMLTLSWLVYLNRGLQLTPHFFIRPIEAVEKGEGHLYIGQVSRIDRLSPVERRSVQVMEDGKVISATASLREQVRLIGNGRYYLSERELCFSSSDNTDPRTNGRNYSLRYALVIPGGAALLVYLLTLLMIAAVVAAASYETSLSRAVRAKFRIVAPILLVNMVLIAALLLIAEMVFIRLYPHLKLTKRWTPRYVDSVGFTFEPGSTVLETNHLEFGTETIANSLGFLDIEPRANTGGACQISIIGDSFVEAAQVKIPEKIQRLLESRAQERFPEWGLRTSAFGFRGTGQLNQLAFYDRYARELRPRLVVLVFVSNDIADNSPIIESLRIGTHPEFPLWTTAKKTTTGMELVESSMRWRANMLDISFAESAVNRPLHRVHLALREWSGLYSWLWLRLSLKYDLVAGLEPRSRDIVKARARVLSQDPRVMHLMSEWDDRYATNLDGEFGEGELPPLYDEACGFTRFGLEEFRRRTERDGARLVILAASQIRSLNNRVYLKLEEIGRELGIPVIDQYSYIAEHGGNPVEAMYNFDMHWTPKGHQWGAEALLQYIEQTGICREPRVGSR